MRISPFNCHPGICRMTQKLKQDAAFAASHAGDISAIPFPSSFQASHKLALGKEVFRGPTLQFATQSDAEPEGQQSIHESHLDCRRVLPIGFRDLYYGQLAGTCVCKPFLYFLSGCLSERASSGDCRHGLIVGGNSSTRSPARTWARGQLDR